MSRELLQSCLPGFLALSGCGIVVLALGQFSRSKTDWSRLRNLHHCESGAVQSLAFVLTFPVLLAVLMVMVQISQLMIGQMVIQYAAFAGARSASVWIPALTPEELANQITDAPQASGDDGMLIEVSSTVDSAKLRKIRSSVIQACAPMAPSRDLGATAQSPEILQIAAATQQLLPQLVPSLQSNSRLPVRLANKLAYSDRNTQVFITWQDAQGADGGDSTTGPSFNPRNHPTHVFDANEAGWQDPVTVHVVHQFALLPGPGRLLAKPLVRADGLPDRVSGRITTNARDYSETVYTTPLHASATMTLEGIKSVRPFLQDTP